MAPSVVEDNEIRTKKEDMPRLRSIVGLLFATLYLWYFAGTHFFVHSHTWQHVTITHSHPFAGQHSHSGEQMQLIDQLCHYCLTDDSCQQVVQETTWTRWDYAQQTEQRPTATSPRGASLRAPPQRMV